MKRTQIFTLIMAIFWTIIAVAAVVLATRTELRTESRIVLMALVFVMVIGNWLRYFRSR